MTKERMTYEQARSLIEDGVVSKLTTVDTEVLCAYFKCSPKTIRRRVEMNDLPPPTKIGRVNHWRTVDIRKIKERLIKQTPFKQVA